MATHVPAAHRKGADTHMPESIPFSSMCPKCRNPQLQRGFSRATLQRLLDDGHPIEAYCALCDDFWSISAVERVALAREVLA